MQKVINQNRSLLKNFTLPFRSTGTELLQFSYVLAAKLPTTLFEGEDHARIVDKDFDHDQFYFSSDGYRAFADWIIQTLSHLRSDNHTKGRNLTREDESKLSYYRSKTINPDPKDFKRYSDFSA